MPISIRKTSWSILIIEQLKICLCTLSAFWKPLSAKFIFLFSFVLCQLAFRFLMNRAISMFERLNLSLYPVFHAKASIHKPKVEKCFCSVLAAKNLGDAAYNNFLDHTFLGDRTTTIRQYLATTGSGIMEEEPPESLKTRYGGWYVGI